MITSWLALISSYHVTLHQKWTHVQQPGRQRLIQQIIGWWHDNKNSALHHHSSSSVALSETIDLPLPVYSCAHMLSTRDWLLNDHDWPGETRRVAPSPTDRQIQRPLATGPIKANSCGASLLHWNTYWECLTRTRTFLSAWWTPYGPMSPWAQASESSGRPNNVLHICSEDEWRMWINISETKYFKSEK